MAGLLSIHLIVCQRPRNHCMTVPGCGGRPRITHAYPPCHATYYEYYGTPISELLPITQLPLCHRCQSTPMCNSDSPYMCTELNYRIAGYMLHTCLHICMHIRGITSIDAEEAVASLLFFGRLWIINHDCTLLGEQSCNKRSVCEHFLGEHPSSLAGHRWIASGLCMHMRRDVS